MSQERDTHFAGFADIVAQEIGKNVNIIFDTAFWPEEYYLEAISKIIVQRAYDLVCHSLGYTQDDLYIDPEDLITRVPDLTEWPKVEGGR